MTRPPTDVDSAIQRFVLFAPGSASCQRKQQGIRQEALGVLQGGITRRTVEVLPEY